MKLITYLHPVSSLKMSGAIPLLPAYEFVDRDKLTVFTLSLPFRFSYYNSISRDTSLLNTSFSVIHAPYTNLTIAVVCHILSVLQH